MFDVMLRGFCLYVRRRLELLGFHVHCPQSIHDSTLIYLADMGCIIVTLDRIARRAARHGRIIIKLPYIMRAQTGKPKRHTYEEWWTLLCRRLHTLDCRDIIL